MLRDEALRQLDELSQRAFAPTCLTHGACHAVRLLHAEKRLELERAGCDARGFAHAPSLYEVFHRVEREEGDGVVRHLAQMGGRLRERRTRVAHAYGLLDEVGLFHGDRLAVDDLDMPVRVFRRHVGKGVRPGEPRRERDAQHAVGSRLEGTGKRPLEGARVGAGGLGQVATVSEPRGHLLVELLWRQVDALDVALVAKADGERDDLHALPLEHVGGSRAGTVGDDGEHGAPLSLASGILANAAHSPRAEAAFIGVSGFCAKPTCALSRRTLLSCYFLIRRHVR